MRLGREMHDRVNLLVTKQRHDAVPIGDIAFDEAIPIVARNRLQTCQISRVGQRVEHHNPVLWIPAHPVLHEVGTNEARTACPE